MLHTRRIEVVTAERPDNAVINPWQQLLSKTTCTSYIILILLQLIVVPCTHAATFTQSLHQQQRSSSSSSPTLLKSHLSLHTVHITYTTPASSNTDGEEEQSSPFPFPQQDQTRSYAGSTYEVGLIDLFFDQPMFLQLGNSSADGDKSSSSASSSSSLLSLPDLHTFLSLHPSHRSLMNGLTRFVCADGFVLESFPLDEELRRAYKEGRERLKKKGMIVEGNNATANEYREEDDPDLQRTNESFQNLEDFLESLLPLHPSSRSSSSLHPSSPPNQLFPLSSSLRSEFSWMRAFASDHDISVMNEYTPYNTISFVFLLKVEHQPFISSEVELPKRMDIWIDSTKSIRGKQKQKQKRKMMNVTQHDGDGANEMKVVVEEEEEEKEEEEEEENILQQCDLYIMGEVDDDVDKAWSSTISSTSHRRNASSTSPSIRPRLVSSTGEEFSGFVNLSYDPNSPEHHIHVNEERAASYASVTNFLSESTSLHVGVPFLPLLVPVAVDFILGMFVIQLTDWVDNKIDFKLLEKIVKDAEGSLKGVGKVWKSMGFAFVEHETPKAHHNGDEMQHGDLFTKAGIDRMEKELHEGRNDVTHLDSEEEAHGEVHLSSVADPSSPTPRSLITIYLDSDPASFVKEHIPAYDTEMREHVKEWIEMMQSRTRLKQMTEGEEESEEIDDSDEVDSTSAISNSTSYIESSSHSHSTQPVDDFYNDGSLNPRKPPIPSPKPKPAKKKKKAKKKEKKEKKEKEKKPKKKKKKKPKKAPKSKGLIMGPLKDQLTKILTPKIGKSLSETLHKSLRSRIHDLQMDGLAQYLTEELIPAIARDVAGNVTKGLNETIPDLVDEGVSEILAGNLRQPVHEALARSLGHSVGLTLMYTLRDVGRQEPVCYYCEFIDPSYCKLCYRTRDHKYQKYEDQYAMDYWIAMYEDEWIRKYIGEKVPE